MIHTEEDSELGANRELGGREKVKEGFVAVSLLNENPLAVSAPEEKLKLKDEEENMVEAASEDFEGLEEDSGLTLEAKVKLKLVLSGGAEESLKAAELKDSAPVFAKSKKLVNGLLPFSFSALSSPSFFSFSSSCVLSSFSSCLSPSPSFSSV